MRTYSQIFPWNHNVHLLDIHHLTIFPDIVNLDLKETENEQKILQTISVVCRFGVKLSSVVAVSGVTTSVAARASTME